MVKETVLQHWVLTDFVYPFLLVYFIVFAILQKSKVLGAKSQIDALTAFVIGFIFVAAVQPKLIVGNMVLFLSVAMVVVFTFLLLWGFLVGKEPNFLSEGKVKWAAGGVVLVAVIIATLWAAEVENDFYDFLFSSSWSESFWVNFIFIALVIVALSVSIKSASGGGGK